MSIERQPWTDEQVANLNAFQQAGTCHPFTCGSSRRTDADHLDGEGVLVATPQGWVCPYCNYRQDWCLGFMMRPVLYDFKKEVRP